MVLSSTSPDAPDANPSADTSGKLDELAVVSVVLIVLIEPRGLSDPDVGLETEELFEECCVSRLRFSRDGKF